MTPDQLTEWMRVSRITRRSVSRHIRLRVAMLLMDGIVGKDANQSESASDITTDMTTEAAISTACETPRAIESRKLAMSCSV